MAHPNERARARLKKYLKGDGLELGALHMPLDLTGCDVDRIRYVDRMSETDLRTHYPELAALPLVKVEVIDDAGTLQTVPAKSLDFIVANHLIEHMPDPIGSIRCWFEKLKRGGVIYMAVPDMRRTFDKDRPLTPISHFLEDHTATLAERKARDREAFYEWSRLVNKTAEEKVEAEVQHLVDMDYSIHYHTFTYDSMRTLLREIQKRFCPEMIFAAEEPTAITSNECIFILAKEVAPIMPSRWGRFVAAAKNSISGMRP